MLAGEGLIHTGTLCGEGVEQTLVGDVSDRSVQYRVDPAADGGDAPCVIDIEVREHQKVDAIDAERP